MKQRRIAATRGALVEPTKGTKRRSSLPERFLWRYVGWKSGRRLAKETSEFQRLAVGGDILGRMDVPIATRDKAATQCDDRDGITKLLVGPQERYIVHSPQFAKEILTRADTDKEGVLETLKPLLGEGILTSSGEKWTRRRKDLVPIFKDRWLSSIAADMRRAAEDLVESLKANDDGPVDINENLRGLALEVAGRTMFNFDFGTFRGETKEERAAIGSIGSILSKRTLSPFRYWKIPGANWLIREERQMQKQISSIQSVLERIIRAAEPNDGSMVDYLMKQGREGEGLRDDIVNLFIAGHETTGATMAWTVFCLAQLPEQMELVRKEVDEVMAANNDAIEYESAWELKRTRMAISEALRLFPSPAVVGRRVREDFTLSDGRIIEAGNYANVSMWWTHRRSDLWERAEEYDLTRWERQCEWYDPDQWLSSSLHPTLEATQWRFLPFAAGPRACLGDQFAFLEATIALAVLFRNLDVELACRPQDIYIGNSVFSPFPLDGMPVRLYPREK